MLHLVAPDPVLPNIIMPVMANWYQIDASIVNMTHKKLYYNFWVHNNQ